MATHPPRSATVLSVAMVVCCVILWRFTFTAGDVGVPGWWPWFPPTFGDVLFALGLAVIYAVVAVERRSWVKALVVLVPVGGIVYSLVSFWRLGSRLAIAPPGPPAPMPADRRSEPVSPG